MHKRKLSAEQKAEIVRLYPEKGESQSSIAKRYGIDETAVQKYTARFFIIPFAALVYAGGKESGLMVTILGERRASPSRLPQTEEPSFVCLRLDCVDL